jgi:hypothetical protein
VRLLGAGVHNLMSVEDLTGTGVLPFESQIDPHEE